MDDEKWTRIGPAGYADHYQVSDQGMLRRCTPGPNTRPGKLLTLSINRGVHPVVKLSAGGITRSFALAPLVAAAYLPPKPAGAILMHRDGDRSNCAADNLYWASMSDRRARRRSLSTCQESEVLALKGKLSGIKIAQRFGVSASTVRRTLRMGK